MPSLERNVFSNVDTVMKIDAKEAAMPEGNLNTDADSEAPPDWPVKLHQLGPIDDEEEAVGYVMPGGINSLRHNETWPVPLPAELEIIPKGDTRDYEEWNTSGKTRAELAKTRPSKRQRQKMLAAAREAVKPWIDDAFQLDDVAKRDASIEKVRNALQSDDPDAVRKGLLAFTQLGAIRFDKASFHDLFLPLLEAEDAWLRGNAARGLVMSGVQEGDLDRLIAMIDDPDREVRQNIGSQIVWAAEKDLTGKAGDAVLKLLNEEDRQLRKHIMNVMWGGTYSPAVEARVIEISRDYENTNSEGYDALYFALSTQANKSEASVNRLIEFLANRDTLNVGGRAAWGLGRGVAEAQHGLVADAALKVIASRSESYVFRQSLERLEQYAGPGQGDGIKALLARPGVDGDLRTKLKKILAEAEAR